MQYHIKYNYLIKKTLSAFTLAEVLITLLIIGVVSSLVIPAIIQDTQDAELKVALKKTYSTLSQANTKLLMDNAGSIKNLSTNSDNFKSLFLPYLNKIKSCNIASTEGCWHLANNWYNLNPNTSCGLNAGILNQCSNKNNTTPGLRLSDGTLLTFQLWDGTCEDSTSFTGFKLCGFITVDINGFKGPNTVGKDIFAIWISSNRISPVGYDDVTHGACETSTGWGCTAQRLKE
jgi:prepilin-type N-terminal cleavage/methylation domain-containing protein